MLPLYGSRRPNELEAGRGVHKEAAAEKRRGCGCAALRYSSRRLLLENTITVLQDAHCSAAARGVEWSLSRVGICRRVRVSVCCLSWTRSSQVTVRTGERERGGRQKRDRTCVGGPPALLSPEVFMIAWSDTLARCMCHITYDMLIHVTFGRKRSDGPEVRALEGARGWRVVAWSVRERAGETRPVAAGVVQP